MKTEIVKIKFRRGTEAERSEVIFDEGEPAYTTDTKRLIIGDGTTKGGNTLPKWWFENSLDSINNPVNNDIALIHGSLWWYNQNYWEPIGGVENYGQPNPSMFETSEVEVDGVKQYWFNIKFKQNFNPVLSSMEGLYLNYSDVFNCFDNQLDIPFDVVNENGIETDGPIGIKYNISAVTPLSNVISGYEDFDLSMVPGSEELFGTTNNISCYSNITDMSTRSKDWQQIVPYLDETKFQIIDGYKPSLTSIPPSLLSSSTSPYIMSLYEKCKDLDALYYWWQKPVKIISLK